MVRLISLVPMKTATWVLAHLGMQHGNLIHHRFLEIMELRLVVVIVGKLATMVDRVLDFLGFRVTR